MGSTGTCDRGSEVSAYHDNALGDEKRIALEGHLQTCASCARELESLRRMTRLFEAARTVPPPTVIKLSDVRERRSALRFEMSLIGMAASILIVCGAWLATSSSASAEERLDTLVLQRSSDADDPVLQAMVKEYGRD